MSKQATLSESRTSSCTTALSSSSSMMNMRSRRRMKKTCTTPTTPPTTTTTALLSTCVTILLVWNQCGIQTSYAFSSFSFLTNIRVNNALTRKQPKGLVPTSSSSSSSLLTSGSTLRTRLSIAHSPNVRQGDEMDDPYWFNTGEMEVEWRSVIDPPYFHQHHQNHDNEDDGNDQIRTAMSSTTSASAAASSTTTTTSTAFRNDPLTRHDWQTISGITASVSLLLAVMMHFSGAGAWRYYLAGGVCAAISHAIPVPVDVIKTRKQVDPAYCDLSMPVALKRLLDTEGLSSLFVGMGPTFWGYFVEGAVKFGVYEILKPWLGKLLPNQLASFCACACLSGLAAGIMLCPMEALRIRLVAEREFAQQGWVRGGLRMMQREGLSGLTRGMTPMLYKQVPYTITKNVSFDFFTKLLYSCKMVGGRAYPGGLLSVLIPLVAAAAASVLSCLSSQPGDMLLSLVNAHEGERRRTRDLMQQIYHSDRGLRGFMVGVKTRLLHVGMIVTVQLLIYDFVKRLFGIAATGSV